MSEHIPVLENEVIRAFSEQELKPQKILDGTFGRGGHTRSLLKQFPLAKVYGFDRDKEAIDFGQKSFAEEISSQRLELINDDFRAVASYKIGPFDGALFDLGVSSPQFDKAERGFSFQEDGPLDMRMDLNQETTAATIVNESSEKELSDIFYNLGEIRFPNKVVRAIVHDRKTEPFTTTRALAGLIERVEKRRGGRIHVATPYFMALRIAVNKELEGLEEFFNALPGHLNEGARVAVITFHSLEDRIIKWTFKALDPGVGHVVNKKVIIASDEETKRNPRSRSAKLRVFQKGERP